MRAFSRQNHHETFRINHYLTRSLEDLVDKCTRGRADGAPNADYDYTLKQVSYPLTEDYSVKPYADLVRKQYGEY